MDVEIPREVDSQMQVLWWEIDELFAAMIVFSAGLMTHRFLIPLILAFVVMHHISKMKAASLPGGGLHLLYSTGLIAVNKEFEDSLEKEFYL